MTKEEFDRKFLDCKTKEDISSLLKENPQFKDDFHREWIYNQLQSIVDRMVRLENYCYSSYVICIILLCVGIIFGIIYLSN